MTTNIANQIPFLRTSRNFPLDAQPLAVEVNKSYLDIANAVNARTIGIFSTDVASITGESWFVNSQRQQTSRQLYTFTGAGSIPHGINTANIGTFVRCWGGYTDGTNFYGVIWTTTVGLAGQVTFYVSPTNIVITVDGAAPAVTSGMIVLEWLNNV